jgi:voltage-gated potassium channel
MYAARGFDGGAAMTIRHRLYLELDPGARTAPGFSVTNKIIMTVILVSVVMALAGTEDTLTVGFERWWRLADGFVIAFFLGEYVCRVWVSVENPAYSDGWRGRLRYARSAPALIDLAVLAPTLLFAVGSEAFLLRLVRLMRILQLARLGRFSRSMTLVTKALSRRASELVLAFAFAMMLVVISSTMLYLIEGGIQPEAFGSIPRAMWWSIATLTTVGYGDVYPVTGLGRLFAAITALMGICLIAMPAGIFASALSDALEERRREEGTDE